jgi:type II secretory pathway predicted ATPase ExeA
MDASYFGLRHRPFRTAPDADSYYPATGHEQALARLHQAMKDDEGLALLTGEPGTGKTLLCHRLLEQLGPEIPSAFLTHSHFAGRAGLLQAILYDLSLSYEGKGEQELRLALTDYLLQNFAAGKRTVFVVDEAQHLTPDLLEELRLLGNLESRQGKAVQIVLAGQPTMEERLRLPELAVLAQRLVARPRLEPLGVHEAADYLYHQLRLAGARPEQVLSEEAADVLARGTRGVPRLLNQAAHQALALAQQGGAITVDAEAALEALAFLGLEAESEAAAATNFPTLITPESSDSEAEEAEGQPVLSLTEEATAPDEANDSGMSRRYAMPQRPA